MAKFTCANQRFDVIIIQHLDELHGVNKRAYKELLERCRGLLRSTSMTVLIFSSPQFLVNHFTTLHLIPLEEVHIHIQHGGLMWTSG